MWSVFLFLFLLHPCVSCPAGEYKTSSGCQTCPTGYTSLANDVSCFPSKRIALAMNDDLRYGLIQSGQGGAYADYGHTQGSASCHVWTYYCAVDNFNMTCNFDPEIPLENVVDVQMVKDVTPHRYAPVYDPASRTYTGWTSYVTGYLPNSDETEDWDPDTSSVFITDIKAKAKSARVCALYTDDTLRCNRGYVNEYTNEPVYSGGGKVFANVLSFHLYAKDRDSRVHDIHLDITFHSADKKAFYRNSIVMDTYVTAGTNKYFQFAGPLELYQRSSEKLPHSDSAYPYQENIRLLENPRNVFINKEWYVAHTCDAFTTWDSKKQRLLHTGLRKCLGYDYSTIRCEKNNTTRLVCTQLGGETTLHFEDLMPPHDEVLDVDVGGKHMCGIFRTGDQVFPHCWRIHFADEFRYKVERDQYTGANYQTTPALREFDANIVYNGNIDQFNQLHPISPRRRLSTTAVYAPRAYDSWVTPVGPGCQNPVACNYNYLANESDPIFTPCALPFSPRYRCDLIHTDITRYIPEKGLYVHNPGKCIADVDLDNNGWCDDEEVFGCTDTKACNSQLCTSTRCKNRVGLPCTQDSDCLSFTCLFDEDTSTFKCAHPVTEDVNYKRTNDVNIDLNWEYITKPTNNFCRYAYNEYFKCKENDRRFPVLQGEVFTNVHGATDNDVYLSVLNRDTSMRCIDIFESYCDGTCSDVLRTTENGNAFTTNDACCACGGGRIFDTSRGTPIMDFNQDGIPDPWTLMASTPLQCFFNPFSMTLLPNQTEYYYEQPYDCVSKKDRICDDPYASNYNFTTTSLAPSYRIDDRLCTYEFTVDTTQAVIVNTSNRCALSGCTNPFACNFDVSAGIDDGSCDFSSTCSSDIAIPIGGSYTNVVRHCEVSDWSPWTPCTAYCGNSTRTRNRNITQQPRTIFGAPCPNLQETESCNVPSCDTDFIVHIEHDTHICKLYSDDQLVSHVTVCPLHDYTYACANCLYTYQNISIRDTTFIGPNTGVFAFEHDNSISCAEQSLLIDASFEGCSLEQLQTLYGTYGCTSTCLSEQCTEIFNQITFKDDHHQQRCDMSTNLCRQDNYDSFWLEESCSCNSPKRINSLVNTCFYFEDSCGKVDGLNACQDTCNDTTAKNYLVQNTACEYCPEGTSGENCQYCDAGYGREDDRAYLLAPKDVRPEKCYLCENDFYNNASNTTGPCATASCPVGHGYYFARSQDSGASGMTAAQWYIGRVIYGDYQSRTFSSWPQTGVFKLNSATSTSLSRGGTVFRYKNNTWHTICDDNFDNALAADICSKTCNKEISDSEVSFSFEDTSSVYETLPYILNGLNNYNSTCTNSKRIAVTCPIHCFFDDNVITDEDVLDIYDEQHADGLAAQPGCLQCQPGSFSDSNTTGQCQACPTGFFTAQDGAEHCQPHSLCQPGRQRTNQRTTTEDTVCEACPEGFYSENYGSCVKCSCPAGKYALGCGGASAGECIDNTCITGDWSPWSTCTNCVQTRTRDVLFKASGYDCPNTETQTCCINECNQTGYDNYVSNATHGDASLCTCNQGRFYNGTTCKPFSTCEDGAQIAVPGDATRDVECECVAGRFYNGTACQIHSTCNAGFESVGGNTTHDVECVACAAETYSTDGTTCNLCADISCPTGQDNRNCGGNSSGTCSKDCVVGPWSAYGACSVVCGNGTMTRTRQNQAPIGNGIACPTENSDTVACNTLTCDQHCINLRYDKADENDDCICNDGRFFDVDDGTCKPYSTCPLGTQRESDGTQTSDVTCATCEYIHCATATQIKNRYRTVVEQSCASMGNVTENIFARIADASRMQLYSAYMNRYNGTCTS